MTLGSSKHKWSCVADSFAMALGLTFDQLAEIVGHDGRPNSAGRMGGFHVQECIDAALSLGVTVTPIELFPVARVGEQQQPVLFGDKEDHNWRRFTKYLSSETGVITGVRLKPDNTHSNHAVAFENGVIYDPIGHVYDYSREACEARHFYTQCLWCVRKHGT